VSQGESRAIVIVDRHAGEAAGHHRHWYELMIGAIDDDVVVRVVREGPDVREQSETVQGRVVHVYTVPNSGSRTSWYREGLSTALSLGPKAIVLTSGDDALAALVRDWRAVRRAGIDIRALMFRLSAQPRRAGRVVSVLKLSIVEVARVAVPRLTFFELELPIGRRPRSRTLIGIRHVTDSSAAEQQPGVGFDAARHQMGLGDVSGPVILTVGMLGPGKHIDTLLESWSTHPIQGGRLLFAGVADSETHQLLERSAATVGGVEYRPGRVGDEDFDRLIEGRPCMPEKPQ